MQTPAAEKGRSGATKWVAIIVVVVVVVAGGAYFLLVGSGRITPVTIVMPNGVGSNTNLNFQPVTITVVIGVNNTIKWVNQDTVAHTVLSTTAPIAFGSGTNLIQPGQSFTFTFTTSGTYSYFCNIHPAWMKATVVVKARS